MSRKRRPKEPVPAAPVSSKTPTRSRPFFIRHALAISLMAMLALMAYANTFHVPFQFDDTPNIVENLSVHLKSLSFEWLDQLIKRNSDSMRPFAYFTFALNYYFGGLQVFGYHVVNFLIHLSCGILLYGFLLLTLNLPTLKERYGATAFPIALFSSLLFLVHPIQTESVTYIVQRMASMAGMFYLLAMLLYVKGRLSSGNPRVFFWAAAGLSYLLGLFTKENVAILPLFVALYDLYFFQNFDPGPRGKKALFYSMGLVLLIGLLMGIVWGKRYIDVIIEGYQTLDFTLTERTLTQFRVVLYYVTLLIYPAPSRLNLDYDFSTSHGILDPPATLISILIVVGLIGYSVLSARRRPLLSYFILWYFGNLVIESSIFPLEMVFEHRLYLPLVGPLVLFVVSVVGLWEKLWAGVRKSSEFGVRSSEHKAANRSLRGEDLVGITPACRNSALRCAGTDTIRRDYCLWGTFLVLTILLVWGSYERNKDWRDPVTLWQDCVKKSPNKPRPHSNLGFYLVQDRRTDEGVEEYKIALKLNPRFENAHFNLAQAYMEKGLFDQAEAHLNECIRLAPKEPRGYNEIGLIQLQRKNFKEAIQVFKKGLEMKPYVVNLHANLGNAFLQTHQLDEAMAEYRKALQLDPDLPEVYARISEIYMKKGFPEQADQELKKALKIKPSFYEAYLLRGTTLLQEGKTDEAMAEFNRALRFNSKDPRIYNDLGIAYRRKGMLDEAVTHYKKAIALDPSLSDAHSNLGEIYLGRGMVNEALSELQDALRLDPDKPEVHNNLGVIFLQRKRLDEAISSFKSAVAIQPNYGDAYFNLALAYYYKKESSSAAVYAKKAMEVGYQVDPRFLKALHLSP